MCIYVSACVHMSLGVHTGQKRMLDPLELALKVVGNHLTWIPESELGSSAFN